MKQILSSILLVSLFNLFVGCYSYKEVTLDQFRKYYLRDKVRIKAGQEELVFSRGFTDDRLTSWETGDSTIIVRTTELNRDSVNARSINKNIEINYRQIESIEIEEFDLVKTIVVTFGIIGAIIIVFAITSLDALGKMK